MTESKSNPTPASDDPGVSSSIRVSTPGRICLFGEHQDYLQLPVVPCAISLRISIEGKLRNDRTAHLRLPDLRSEKTFSLGAELIYGEERDYFRSSVNVLRRSGYTFSRGCDCTVRGNIPINSGTSSSSALIVTWISFLAQISDQRRPLPAMELARLAHTAEVLEFGEPGGMMDHYSTACGGILAIDFDPVLKVETIDVRLGTFVLGDSGEPKDTRGILARVKNGVLLIARRLAEAHQGFSLHTVTSEALRGLAGELTPAEAALFRGTIRNREITKEARALMAEKPLNHKMLGTLLTEHQAVLRDVLGISTPKIDRMLSAAVGAGAYGGKINGSGGGGCMFAYAPEDPAKVAQAIEREGGRAFVVTADDGTRNEATDE